MKKTNFPKLHLACSTDNFRPVMNHVLINKSHVVVSNAHVLIQYDTNCLFSDEFIEAMPEQFFIHRNVWQKLCKSHRIVTFKNNMINIHYDDYTDYILPIVNDLVYPDYRAVFPKKEDKKEIDYIGINANVLKLLINSLFFGECTKQMKFDFYDKHLGIVVYPQDEHIKAKAIIMPCVINE